MIQGLRQLLVTVILLSGIALSSPEDKPDWVARFNGWCCKKLGYGCGTPKVTRTRGNDQIRPKGGSLMDASTWIEVGSILLPKSDV
jgi:hypothetical protein